MTPRGGKRPNTGPKCADGEPRVRIMLILPGAMVRWLRSNLAPGQRSRYVSQAVSDRIEKEKDNALLENP